MQIRFSILQQLKDPEFTVFIYCKLYTVHITISLSKCFPSISSGDRVGKVKMMEIDRCNITYTKIRHSLHSHKHFLSEFSCTYYTLQSHCTENSKQMFPEMKLQQNRHTDRGDLKIAHRYVNEAAQFHFWEYLNWISFAV
jgi:hypothetical protein